MDVLRGRHSTGVAFVDSTGTVDVYKKATNASDFLDFAPYQSLLKVGYNCMMGHNRYATKGEVNNINAHPFEFDNVVGMHNGTLRTYQGLDNYLDFDVDSECLYNHLDTNSAQDLVDKMTGAYALTWYDKRTNKLHFLRNDERPLYYCYSLDGTAMFWASEPWMLDGILGRNGVGYKEIFEVKEDTLYSFDVPKIYATAKLQVGKPSMLKVKRTYPVKKHSAAGKSSSGGSLAHYEGKSVTFYVDGVVKSGFSSYIDGFLVSDLDIDVRMYTPSGGEQEKRLVEERDLGYHKGTVRRAGWHQGKAYLLIDLRSIELVSAFNTVESLPPAVVEGFEGSVLNEEEFNEATIHGCSWCTDTHSFGDDVVFIADDEYICSHCAALPEVKEYFKVGD